MLNIIKEKLDLSPDLKKKINWAKNYTSTSITLEKGHLIRLEPSNLAYVDPHKVISKTERKVIFYPPKLITQSEVDAAIRHMNQEMEEAAEDFYKQGKKTKDSNSFEI